MRMHGAVTVVALGLALAGGTADAQVKPTSSTKQFKYKSGKIDPGMLYTYVRSDLAGTKTGSVLVYIPDRKRVEILRVSPGVEGGQLLTGEMNWDTYTLRQFELWSEGKDGGKKRLATGSFSGEALSMTVEDPALYRGAPGATTFSVPLVQLPAHIYSLDFVTLGLALRHLADPLGSVEIGVLSENLKVGPDSPNFLVSAGKATVAYVEDVDRDGVTCMKYQDHRPRPRGRGRPPLAAQGEGVHPGRRDPRPLEPGLARREDHAAERGEGLRRGLAAPARSRDRREPGEVAGRRGGVRGSSGGRAAPRRGRGARRARRARARAAPRRPARG